MIDISAPTATEVPKAPVFEVDTTKGSILHLFMGLSDRIGIDSAFAPVALYLAAIAITWLPLVIGAALGPWPMLARQDGLRIPFLLDLAAQFTMLVSFPCILILTATDQKVLTRSLNMVQTDGTIVVNDQDAPALAKYWKHDFFKTNVGAQLAGLVIGCIAAYLTYMAFSPAEAGFWMAKDGRFLPVGYIYLYCNVLFYGVLTIYVVRNIGIAKLLYDIVAHADLHILPMHPDNSGGLKPVGRLALRNQYALMFFGLNIIAGVAVVHVFQKDQYSELQVFFTVVAIVAYLILGPVVFVGPLLPFRLGMLKNKAQLMSKVASNLRIKLQTLYAKMGSGEITVEDEESVQRLRRLGEVIDDLPVWPFDAFTLRKFLTAYVLPLVGSAGFTVARMLFDYLKGAGT